MYLTKWKTEPTMKHLSTNEERFHNLYTTNLSYPLIKSLC